ncbi:MAG TPA: hypothetical protein VIH86_15920 [Puia sp.]
MFKDILKDIQNPEFWFAVFICGVAVHFLFKFLDKFLVKRSTKAKLKFEKKKLEEKLKVKYYASNFNLLLMRNQWSANISIFIVQLFAVTTVVAVLAIYLYLSSLKSESSILIIISSLLILATLFVSSRTDEERKRIKEATDMHIELNTIGSYFKGKWYLTFSKPEHTGNEIAEIKDGNKYYANDKLKFIILNFQVNLDTNQITLEKHNDAGLYSKETLKIQEDKSLIGSGTTGFKLEYKRIVAT